MKLKSLKLSMRAALAIFSIVPAAVAQPRTISTVVGNGLQRQTDKRPATSVQMYSPNAVAFDKTGNFSLLIMPVNTFIRLMLLETSPYLLAMGRVVTLAMAARQLTQHSPPFCRTMATLSYQDIFSGSRPCWPGLFLQPSRLPVQPAQDSASEINSSGWRTFFRRV